MIDNHRTTTHSFAEWLNQTPSLLPLDPNSFAFLALPTDFDHVVRLNADVRSVEADWAPGHSLWPDDDWIIGEDGAGNYFTVAKTGCYHGVREYHHELKRFEDFQPTIRAYFDYVIGIEIRAAQTRNACKQ